jgi:hypothetical protein
VSRVFYTNEAVMQLATELDTAMLLSTIDLYQDSLVPGIQTTQAELAAAVANYSGYAQIPVAALLPPYLDPAGGASTNMGTVQFQHSGGAVANTIGGAWMEDAAGNVRIVVAFDQPIPMSAATDAIPIDVVFNFKN